MDPWQRAYFLPVARNSQSGDLSAAMPQAVIDLLKAFQLPGDVYQGNVQRNVPLFEGGDAIGELATLEVENPDYIKRLSDLAGALTLGSGAIPAEKGALRAGAGIPKKEGVRAYHGSQRDFDQFRFGTGKTARDIYLSPIEDDARQYGNKMYEVLVGGKIGNFTPDGRGIEEYKALENAYNGGLSDYWASFDEFLEAFDNGDMYQQFGSSYAQDDVIGNLLAEGFDAVRIPDMGFGGRMSESIVTQNPEILKIVRKYGVAAAVSAGVISQADGEALAAQGYE